MTYIPKKNNKALNIACALIIIGIIVFAMSNYIIYPALFQLISLGAIVAGVFLLTRYVLPEYRYIIDDREDGNSDLIVIKKQGSREIKVCHIALSAVSEVICEKYGRVKCDERYNYAVNIASDTVCVIFSDGDRTSCVMLEADAAFCDELKCRTGSSGTENDITFAM